MKALITFANEEQELIRLSSDALKYACQNWAVHLSRAPNPWNEMLNHKFQAFWNHHLLFWLQRQWCLKGLRSCLVILSEGQKFVKPRPVDVQPGDGTRLRHLVPHQNTQNLQPEVRQVQQQRQQGT